MFPADLHLLRGAQVRAPDDLGVCDVLVGGGRILAVGELGAPGPGWPVEVHDLRGHTLIPGLVDLHVHIGGGGGEGGAHTRVAPLRAHDLLSRGVTTAVGLLGTDATTRTLQDLLACARGLEVQGVTAFCHTGAYEVPPPTLTGSVRGDIVHVDRFVAVGELAISDHRSSQPALQELLRIAADAHVAGMMTGKAGLVHLHVGDGDRGLALIREALGAAEIPPRTFHPTHINRSGRLLAEALALSPLGPTVDVTAFPDGDGGVPAHQAVLRYLRAGLDPGRITLSSDAGGCLPTFDAAGVLLHMDVGDAAGLLRTVLRLVDAGVAWAEALAPCTSNAAGLYRLRGKGRIAVGADADLCMLDADRSLAAVWARGRRVWPGPT
jgi:beta-aspartyl-dipeptidase (metallo-type)